jgi:hypothetical protein
MTTVPLPPSVEKKKSIDKKKKSSPQQQQQQQPQPQRQRPSAVASGFASAAQGVGAKKEAVREWGGSAPAEDPERDEGFAWARRD